MGIALPCRRPLRCSLTGALLVLLGAGCAAPRGAPAVSPRERARTLVEAGKPAEALALLESLHAAAPEDLSLARALTEAQVKAGRTDAWIAELERRNALRERASQHYMLGLAHFSRAAGAGAPARAAFERAIALAPSVPELHHRLGVALVESEQYGQAVAPLRRAVALSPGRPGLLLPLAKALHRTGDAAGAVAALSALVQGAPTAAEVATARALMEQIADPFARLPKAAAAGLEEGLRALRRAGPAPAGHRFLRGTPAGLPGPRGGARPPRARLPAAGRRGARRGRVPAGAGAVARGRQDAPVPGGAVPRAPAPRGSARGAGAGRGAAPAAGRRLVPAGRRTACSAATCRRPGAPSWCCAICSRGPLPRAASWPWCSSWRETGQARNASCGRCCRRIRRTCEFALRLGLLHTERAGRAATEPARRSASEEAQRWLRQVLQAQPENAVASRALASLRAQ